LMSLYSVPWEFHISWIYDVFIQVTWKFSSKCTNIGYEQRMICRSGGVGNIWSETEQFLLLAHASGPHENVRMASMQKRMRRWIRVNHEKKGGWFMWNIKHILDQIANILWHVTWKWKNKS
jgi:hypothetical protein